MKRFLLSLFIVLVLSVQGLVARTYILSTGVSNYNDEQNNLHQTTKDAKTFKELMANKSRDISILTSSYANHDNILKNLKMLAGYTQEDDVLIFFYSGHGCPGALYTYDQTVTYQEIVNVLKTARAKKIFCFIDACFGGSCRDALTTNGKMAYSNICFLVSSRADETSKENSLVGAGFFTQALVEGMRGKADSNRDTKVTIEELFKFMAHDVAKRSQESQHPQLYAVEGLRNYVIY